MYILANDGHFEGFLNSFTLQLQHHSSTRHATKIIAHLADGQSFRRLTVNRYNTIARLYARALSRLAFIRVHGICPKAVFRRFLACLDSRTRTLLNNTANTTVLAGSHHTQVLVFLFGIIDGVRIYLTQHRVDGCLCQILVVEGIDIVHIHLTQHIGEDIDALIRTGSGLSVLRHDR